MSDDGRSWCRCAESESDAVTKYSESGDIDKSLIPAYQPSDSDSDHTSHRVCVRTLRMCFEAVDVFARLPVPLWSARGAGFAWVKPTKYEPIRPLRLKPTSAHHSSS